MTKKRTKKNSVTTYLSGEFIYYNCKHCGKLNVLATKGDVKVLREWKKGK